jgi:WS/DGAT/MGAT family acyltransferase
MSDTEALLWALEDDPGLRSAFVSITFVDQVPDFPRFRSRIAQALTVLPALTRRVAPSPPFVAPRWEPDPTFDLDLHVRRLGLPAPGSDRQVLDLAALIGQDRFDPARPLWQFTMVEGLSGDRAALITKMHHVLADGIGAVRMSAFFLDLGPDTDAPMAVDGFDGAPPQSGVRQAVSAAGQVAGGVLSLVRQPQQLPQRALEGVGLARSLARQVAIGNPARSPLWAGKHTFAHRFDTVSVGLGETKAAAARLGGTVNDVFVTAVAGAAGAYHRQRGVEVDDLCLSMPISTRHDRAAGGNAWAPSRVLVPAGEADPKTRFTVVHERLAATKREPSLGLASSLSGMARTLPPPLLARVARTQTSSVDFACSNVRGAPFDLWIAGARVLANHPMGPTAGTAFNATVLSYRDRLDLGLNTDVGAVDDPAALRDLIEAGFAELFDT